MSFGSLLFSQSWWAESWTALEGSRFKAGCCFGPPVPPLTSASSLPGVILHQPRHTAGQWWGLQTHLILPTLLFRHYYSSGIWSNRGSVLQWAGLCPKKAVVWAHSSCDEAGVDNGCEVKKSCMIGNLICKYLNQTIDIHSGHDCASRASTF